MVGRCNNDQVVAPLRVVKVAAARHKSTYSKSTAGTLSLWRGGSNSPPVIEELLRQVDEALCEIQGTDIQAGLARLPMIFDEVLGMIRQTWEAYRGLGFGRHTLPVAHFH